MTPVAAVAVAAGGTVPPALPLRQVRVDGERVYWLENRPEEDARGVIVCWDGRRVRDVTPRSRNVGSRVYEYGGGDFAVRDGVVWYVDADDQQLYRQEGGSIALLSLGSAGARLGAPVVAPDGREVVCVRELRATAGEPGHALVRLPAQAPGEPTVVFDAADFVADPAVSPDGGALAWVAWRHPHMPWTESELWLGERAGSGSVTGARKVAGGDGQSVLQPAWSPGGELYFACDRSGWWNIHRLEDGRTTALTHLESDIGAPQWLLGLTAFAFLDDGRVVFVRSDDGVHRLQYLDPESGEIDDPKLPFTAFVPAAIAAAERAAFVAASPTEALAVVSLDPASGRTRTLRPTVAAPPQHVSLPEPFELAAGNGVQVYGFLYRPEQGDAQPPLVVNLHGGPTNAAAAKLDLGTQFWTSRGFVFLDLNYGGSSGYGRAYRERLRGGWGIVDVADTIAAAQAAVERGLADARRLVVRGTSAGGFTVCHALAGESVFAAGTSYFGVLDLERLAAEMHKFEAHYLEWLVGAQEQSAYRERSPLHIADAITRPLLVLQGLADRVVPPAQAEAMVACLRERRLPLAYLAFDGEAHGFRRADTIARCLEAEYAFYCRVLGLEPLTRLVPLEIENLTEGGR